MSAAGYSHEPILAAPDRAATAVSRAFGYLGYQLAISTVAAVWFVQSSLAPSLWVIGGAVAVSLLLLLIIAFGIEDLGLGTLRALLGMFAVAQGVLLGSCLGRVELGMLLSAVGCASAVFLIMALYGYLTRRNLQAWGTSLFMTLCGLLLATLLGLVLNSGALLIALSAGGVVLFSLYTAHDVNRVRDAASGATSDEEVSRIAIEGGLDLYLDFANLVLDFLRLIRAFR